MTKIRSYCHRVQYYETDQMKIVHHSNYIRWFEEARVDLMEQMGLPYHALEEMGILSPVLRVQCDYVSMVRFGDSIEIVCTIERFTGVKFSISYEIFDAKKQTLRAKGTTHHCFINNMGKPVHLKKENQKVYDIFAAMMGKG